MIHLVFLSFLLLAGQSYSSVAIYGVGEIGFWPYQASTNFTKLSKYGGGLGLEYNFFSFFSLAAELDHIRGNTKAPVPFSLADQVSPESYGGFREKGVDFAYVNYWELWLRPKLLLPIPLVKPYVSLPLSLLNYGGMQGYSRFGIGLGTLLGLELDLSHVHFFLESGIIVRSRKGPDKISEVPPWGMFDFAIPLRLSLGYKF